MNWTVQTVLAEDADAYGKLVFAIFGVYLWELFQTSNFEWSLITGKRKFVWPMVIFLFLCRYCLLSSLIGLIISLSMSTQINCQALYTFNAWAGNMSILCASTSLMLRTVALWERKLKVLLPLGFLSLAHWALLWRGMFVIKARYDATSDSCEVLYTNHIFLNISFFMTMGFDFVILVFTLAALIPGKTQKGRLWKLLFTDGLVYFLITFVCNMIPAILNVLDLNGVS
ncbi:hypothetical protein B0H21DRAFT_775945 [Amylocystis lapponica]|nr:hypothetical protein B0H21DRAFT_775945 [Amylocystis lapponica]